MTRPGLRLHPCLTQSPEAPVHQKEKRPRRDEASAELDLVETGLVTVTKPGHPAGPMVTLVVTLPVQMSAPNSRTGSEDIKIYKGVVS